MLNVKHLSIDPLIQTMLWICWSLSQLTLGECLGSGWTQSVKTMESLINFTYCLWEEDLGSQENPANSIPGTSVAAVR